MATPLEVEIGAPVNEVPLVSEHHQAPTSNLTKRSKYPSLCFLLDTLAHLESELVPTIAIQLRKVDSPDLRSQLRCDFDDPLSHFEERSGIGMLQGAVAGVDVLVGLEGRVSVVGEVGQEVSVTVFLFRFVPFRFGL